MIKFIIVVHAQKLSFSRYNIFHFSSAKSFQTGCCCLVFLPCNGIHTQQAAVIFNPTVLLSCHF